MGTVQQEAERLIAEAPDLDWLRALTDALDRAVRQKPLERLVRLWGLSNAEAARVFGVSRQAFSKWLVSGVPSDRAPAVADLAAATDLLDRRIKRERIPAVVRRPSLSGSACYKCYAASRCPLAVDVVPGSAATALRGSSSATRSDR